MLTAEGLATSGAKAAANGGNKILGKRQSFVSPLGAAYLLTVATNDGLDDATGTPKQSIIADLNLDEGLRILVATASWNISQRWSAFVRGGAITSAADSALNSNKLGREFDLGGIYQLTPSATVGFDYGYFKPGAFYANHSPASLGSLKYKFSF